MSRGVECRDPAPPCSGSGCYVSARGRQTTDRVGTLSGSADKTEAQFSESARGNRAASSIWASGTWPRSIGARAVKLVEIVDARCADAGGAVGPQTGLALAGRCSKMLTRNVALPPRSAR